MILAQAVLEIFCSQGSIGLQWESQKNIEKMAKSEKEDNLVKYLQNFAKS